MFIDRDIYLKESAFFKVLMSSTGLFKMIFLSIDNLLYMVPARCAGPLHHLPVHGTGRHLLLDGGDERSLCCEHVYWSILKIAPDRLVLWIKVWASGRLG